MFLSGANVGSFASKCCIAPWLAKIVQKVEQATTDMTSEKIEVYLNEDFTVTKVAHMNGKIVKLAMTLHYLIPTQVALDPADGGDALILSRLPTIVEKTAKSSRGRGAPSSMHREHNRNIRATSKHT